MNKFRIWNKPNHNEIMLWLEQENIKYKAEPCCSEPTSTPFHAVYYKIYNKKDAVNFALTWM